MIPDSLCNALSSKGPVSLSSQDQLVMKALCYEQPLDKLPQGMQKQPGPWS